MATLLQASAVIKYGYVNQYYTYLIGCWLDFIKIRINDYVYERNQGNVARVCKTQKNVARVSFVSSKKKKKKVFEQIFEQNDNLNLDDRHESPKLKFKKILFERRSLKGRRFSIARNDL